MQRKKETSSVCMCLCYIFKPQNKVKQICTWGFKNTKKDNVAFKNEFYLLYKYMS